VAGMKRVLVLLAVLATIGVVRVAALLIRAPSPAVAGPVLSVRAALSRLQSPQVGASGGNVLRVRGTLLGGSGVRGEKSSYSEYALGDPNPAAFTHILWVAPEPDPLRSFLRGVPLLGAIVPAPLRGVPLLGAIVPAPQQCTVGLRTYGIRLNAQHTCSAGSCPDASASFIINVAHTQSPAEVTQDARGFAYIYHVTIGGQVRNFVLAVGTSGFIVSARRTEAVR